MPTALRVICKEIRTQAGYLAAGCDESRLARLADASGLVREAIAGMGWLEASGRAAELEDRCRIDIEVTPDAHEVAYLILLAESLADCLERQLASGLDAAFMPAYPESWTFLLLGEGLSGAIATFDLLRRAGFGMVFVATIDELVARPEIERQQAVVVVEAGWLSANPLPGKIDGAPLVVALVKEENLAIRLKALRSGARLLLDQSVSTGSILTSLCGMAWQPAQAYRVMIVDDNKLLLEIHAHVLRSAGYEVLAVQDPLLALDRVEKFDPEVLLLDIEMPGCLGTELASMLRQKESRRLLPVIYLTGHSEAEYLLAARRAGCDDFLHKPVSSEVMIIAVATAARKYRLTRQVECVRTEEREQFYHLRAAIDAHAIVSIATRDGTMIYANDRFCQISGYSRDEMLGKNHRIVRSDEHPAAFFTQMWRTISSGNIWQGEICNRRRDGSNYWVNTSIVPVLGIDGRPRQYISIRTDITKVKEEGERLRRSQIFANIGTWDWDLSRNELIWTERVGALFGRPVLNITHEQYLSYIHAEDRQTLADEVERCLGRGAGYNVEYRCVWPDGSIHWLHERGDVLRGADGSPVRMLGVVQDVTQRKQAEIAMKEARDAAENASRAKSEFLASMSHELRTPLNAILGYAQLFAINPRIPPEIREQTGEIERAGRHLLALVDDLIDLARIESGNLVLTLESVALKTVIDDSIGLISPVAGRYGIELVTKYDVCSSAVLHADYVRLRQVLINLLANAIKYNRPQGAVRIFCVMQDNRVRISVSDMGQGIPLDKQERLFTAFDRLGEECGAVEGSGIGLNITKRIVESMGGTIGFESCMGKGSTFWVEFQVAGAAGIPVASEDEPVRPREISLLQIKRRLVIHIEDNPANQRLMRQIFHTCKELELRDAGSAELGVEMVKAALPSLVLMDINLPGMDGYAALKLLKADARTSAIPVIAISANAMKGEEARGIEAGFAAYVTKPLDVKQFLALIDEMVGK